MQLTLRINGLNGTQTNFMPEQAALLDYQLAPYHRPFVAQVTRHVSNMTQPEAQSQVPRYSQPAFSDMAPTPIPHHPSMQEPYKAHMQYEDKSYPQHRHMSEMEEKPLQRQEMPPPLVVKEMQKSA